MCRSCVGVRRIESERDQKTKGPYRTVGVRFREINCIDSYPIRELKAFISKISVTTQAEFSMPIN